MRPGQQKNRMRGRGRKGPNPLSRSYESNGPDVKIRGNAQHIAEKYTALARDASASGDRVMAENYLQHAEHYGRIVAAAQGTFQLQREETDFEGEYDDEGEENVQENGAPNGHPYPVPERAQNDRPPQQQPNQMRGERGDYSNRDQNRDYNNNRDSQNNRDGQNNRDFNRDGGQGNREPRFNRDDRNRNRDFNRDNQARDRNRDGNRDNRSFNNDERRSFEGRGERNNGPDRGERSQPNGLGPQPIVGELPVAGDAQPPAAFAREERASGFERREPRPAESEANTPAVTQESGFGQAEASAAVLAAPEGSILPPSEDGAQPAAEGPRRRGRPRRPRLGDGDAVPVQAAEEQAVSEPVSEAPAAAAPLAEASAEDAPAKRPRGRPRKKKTDDENAEGDAGHMPDFLLASNG